MTKLLKDMPGHMERIDGNFTLSQEIKDCLENHSEGGWISDIKFQDIQDKILEKLTEFVNQNYEWKGVKS